MTEHEQKMLDMGCPECGEEIELYETNPNGTSGKYKCKSCGRDTFWSVGKALSIFDVVNEMQSKLNES